jgi:CBS domain containing-hemolysin-like protein
MLAPLLVIAVLIVLTAFYVAAEFAAVSVRRSRIRQRAEDGDALAVRLLPILEDPVRLDRYISASQMGITLTSLLVGAFAQATIAVRLAPVFASWGLMGAAASASAATVIVLVVLTAAQMVLSELVPKYLALARPTEVARFTVLPMTWSLAAFSIFLGMLNASAALVLRMVGLKAVGHGHIHSPEEIDLLIAESRDGGLLEADEHRRLRRALQLGIRPARHLMVPRQEIAAVEISTPVEEAMEIVAASPYTRLPVYQGDIDHFVGLLHTRDLFVRRLDPAPLASLAPLVRPILSVPENVTAEALLARMREGRSHQALVLDEFGGVSGLVTLEDVLTEVMGGIADEFKEADPGPEVLSDGRVRLPGYLRLDEVEPWIGILLDGDSDTVGGRVTEELGRVPDPGARATIEGVEFEVEAVEHHAVTWVVATPLPIAGRGGEDGDG